jgi:thioredoxin-related protein
MNVKQVLILVAVALICGGIAGYGSARFANGGENKTIMAARQLRFIDRSGNHQVTLELGSQGMPNLVLKDSTGRLLYELPPSLKVRPVDGS